MLLLSPLFVKLMFVVVVLLLVVELNAVVIQPESVVVAVVLLAAAVSLAVAVELVELVESVELVSFEDFLELSFADQCFVEFAISSGLKLQFIYVSIFVTNTRWHHVILSKNRFEHWHSLWS